MKTFSFMFILASYCSIASSFTINGPKSSPSLLSRSMLFSSLQSKGKVNGTKDNVVDDEQKQQKTLFESFDQAGLRLKPMAVSAREKASTFTYNDAPIQKTLYLMKACICVTAFMLYRSYRGLFVILPAIFCNVYNKLENSVGGDLLAEENCDDLDIDPKTGEIRLRTRLVVSLLASIVTASYMLSGAFKVLTRFFHTVMSTSDVEKSFENAADELMKNEKIIMTNVKNDDDKKISGASKSSGLFSY